MKPSALDHFTQPLVLLLSSLIKLSLLVIAPTLDALLHILFTTPFTTPGETGMQCSDRDGGDRLRVGPVVELAVVVKAPAVQFAQGRVHEAVVLGEGGQGGRRAGEG